MLVLSRRFGEKIFIDIPPDYGGGRITIQQLLIEPELGKSRIGIDADPTIIILREEIDRQRRAVRSVVSTVYDSHQ